MHQNVVLFKQDENEIDERILLREVEDDARENNETGTTEYDYSRLITIVYITGNTVYVRLTTYNVYKK